MIQEFCCHCFPWPWWHTPKRTLNVFHPFPFETRVFQFGERRWLDRPYILFETHVICFLVVSGVHLVLQNYPQGKENTYPAKGGKPENRRAQVVAQEWQNEAQEHKEKLNEVWKCFSREKKSPNPISLLVDLPGLRIGRVFWCFFWNLALEIFWKWQKKTSSYPPEV